MSQQTDFTLSHPTHDPTELNMRHLDCVCCARTWNEKDEIPTVY